MRALPSSLHVSTRNTRLATRLYVQRHQIRLYKRPLFVRCTQKERVMSELSGVMGRLKPSRTVALADLAKTMKEEGQDVISLAVGEPDFPTPEPIVQGGIDALQEGFTKYTQNIGILPLRKAICQKLKRENELDYTEDCVVVSSGAKQAAWQAILSTCGPGDEVIIPAPYWVSYPEMVEMAGAMPKILSCPLSDDFLLSPESLRKALTEKSRLLVLCTPSNPTGAMYSRRQLEALAEVIHSHPRLLVLSDEIYEYMAYPPAEHVSFASLPEMHERTLTINGFSKGFAMTGWRLGYLAASPFYAKACAMIQSHVTSCPCSISQKAGLAALNMGHKGGVIVKDMVETYQHRRDYVIKRLRRIPGIEVLQPDGAFYVFPDVSAYVGGHLHADGADSVRSSEDLCMYLLHNALVVTVPGEAFGTPGHIRISYATSMPLLEEALNRIEHALKHILH